MDLPLSRSPVKTTGGISSDRCFNSPNPVSTVFDTRTRSLNSATAASNTPGVLPHCVIASINLWACCRIAISNRRPLGYVLPGRSATAAKYKLVQLLWSCSSQEPAVPFDYGAWTNPFDYYVDHWLDGEVEEDDTIQRLRYISLP